MGQYLDKISHFHLHLESPDWVLIMGLGKISHIHLHPDNPDWVFVLCGRSHKLINITNGREILPKYPPKYKITRVLGNGFVNGGLHHRLKPGVLLNKNELHSITYIDHQKLIIDGRTFNIDYPIGVIFLHDHYFCYNGLSGYFLYDLRTLEKVDTENHTFMTNMDMSLTNETTALLNGIHIINFNILNQVIFNGLSQITTLLLIVSED